MNYSFRILGRVAAGALLAIGLGPLTGLPAAAQGALLPAVAQAIDQAGCNPDKLTAAIKLAVTASPASAVEIATYATQHCPADADVIAASAAGADPTDVAAILVAVITALPPDQQPDAIAGIVAAVEQAVPGATDQITASIVQLASNFNQNGPTTPGRPGGWPLVSPQTDPLASPR